MHNMPHTAAAKAKMSAARRGKPALWKRRPTREVNGELLYRCGRCEGFFPKAAFHPNRRTVLGIKTECKPCHNACNIASRDPANKRSKAVL